DAEPAIDEDRPQRPAHGDLVLDDEDERARLAHAATPCPASPIGNVTRKTAPPCGRLLAVIVPPWATAIARQIARPSPKPPSRARPTRTNLSKIRSSCPAGMPSPRSATSITTFAPSTRAATSIALPGGVYLA